MNKTKHITQEGWQPIETAPKDGTAVLLCWAINADGKPIDWTADPTTSGVFVQVASWWGGEDEWVVYCSMVRDPSLHFNPTHWMPIPPPPTQEGGGMNENGTGVPGPDGSKQG